MILNKIFDDLLLYLSFESKSAADALRASYQTTSASKKLSTLFLVHSRPLFFFVIAQEFPVGCAGKSRYLLSLGSDDGLIPGCISTKFRYINHASATSYPPPAATMGNTSSAHKISAQDKFVSYLFGPVFIANFALLQGHP
jgi:hypothetical protein